MEGSTRPTEARDTGKIVMAILVAAIVVAVGMVSFVLYTNSQASKASNLPAIKAGDKVMMNYIGRFSDGRIFDTSIASIGQNNALYPKSLTFTSKPNSSYAPFNMTAGNYGSGGTIKGFALGVLGLHEGDHAIIDVPADEAYPIASQFIQKVNLTQELPVIETITDTAFTTSFGASPVVGQIYKHFFWGWDIVVVSDQSGVVFYRQDPYVGQVVYPFGDPNNVSSPAGWAVSVVSYDPAALDGLGSITVEHHVTAADVYNVKGTDVGGQTFVVSGFNATAGNFQITRSDSSTGFNGEIAGRELFFEVFILKVTPSAG